MALVGWALQRLVLERSARGGLLVPMLSTFGLSIVIDNLLFEGFGADTRSLAPYIGDLSYDSWSLTDDIAIGKLAALTFAVAVALLGGIQIFLNRTLIGRAIRATAEDPDTVGLVGVNARRVNAIAAAIAMATVAVAGAFLGMRATFDPYAGAAQLIFAFEASVIGGAGSLWGTLVGGIVLGVAQSLGALVNPQGFFIAGHFAFLVVLFARLFFGDLGQRVRTALIGRALVSASHAAAVERWTPELRIADRRRRRDPRRARGRAGAFQRQRRRQADDAVHLRDPRRDVERARRVLRPGLGRPAGVLRPRRLCRDPPRRLGGRRLSVAVSGRRSSSARSPGRCRSSCCGCKGGEFAIGMWVVAELAHLLVNLDTLVRGETGTSLIALNAYASGSRRALTYWCALAAMTGLLAIVFRLLRSPLGAAIQAIRDNEEAAASIGVRVMSAKRLVFMLAAFGAAMAGALWVATALTFQPKAYFSPLWTAYMIFMALVGGFGTFEGPILGAVIFFAIETWFGAMGVWYLVGLGATALLFALLFPRGFWGWVEDRTSLRLLPIGYRLPFASAARNAKPSDPRRGQRDWRSGGG